MSINFGAAWATARTLLTTVGLNVLGAIVIYVVGRWVIGFVLRGLQRLLLREKFDSTLSRFLGNFGVQTITAGGTTGTVQEVGLFVTTI